MGGDSGHRNPSLGGGVVPPKDGPALVCANSISQGIFLKEKPGEWKLQGTRGEKHFSKDFERGSL